MSQTRQEKPFGERLKAFFKNRTSFTRPQVILHIFLVDYADAKLSIFIQQVI